MNLHHTQSKAWNISLDDCKVWQKSHLFIYMVTFWEIFFFLTLLSLFLLHLHLSFFSWISHHSKRFQVSSHFFSVETHQLFTPSCNSNNKNSLSSSIRSSGYVYLKTIFKFLHLLCSLYFPQLVDFCLFQLFSFSFFFYICDGQT